MTLGRSNAEPFVAAEVEAVRTAAGAYEIAQYARYEVTGPEAEAWLDRLLASRLPEVGRIRLAPMLGERGRLMGDLTVTRLDEDRFWLTGSYHLQDWHLRWFLAHLPERGVELRNVTDAWMGFSISGPNARRILATLTSEDVSNEAFPFLSVRRMDVGSARAVVGRISFTGELGYELVVPVLHHRTLWCELREAGDEHGLRPIGDRALDSPAPREGVRDLVPRVPAGRDPGDVRPSTATSPSTRVPSSAARPRSREREVGPDRRLALLEVEAGDADAAMDDGRVARRSARGARDLGRLRAPRGDEPRPRVPGGGGRRGGGLRGRPPSSRWWSSARGRRARVLPEPPYDPTGSRLRS
ncbi:MAG: hypothetical protein KatS3mg014_2785 [Actinomycetota bacterium]|nr:MAG: hypothetical protein KatS3mg014_2785 [Actinomycetota bacterium]